MIILCLLALFVAGDARPSTSASGQKAAPPATPYIINGQPAAKGRWPWQLALEYLGSHTCGATLIKLDRALTAAHCVYGRDEPSRFQVIVGASNRAANDEEEIRSVISITQHPDYIQGNLYPSDVAVLALDQAVTINQYVAVATLAAAGSNWVGKEAWISGWGKLVGTDSTFSTQLMEAQTSVISNSDCSAAMPECCRNLIAGHQCVYDATHGFCQGDSGGPLHVFDGVNWFVDGAASWVMNNATDTCTTSYPSVYARASEYRDWILAQ